MTDHKVDALLLEIRNGLKVLHNEAVETRRVLKMLVGVLNDTQQTNELLRVELSHVRTHREQADRAHEFAIAVDNAATEPKETR